MSLTPGTRLGPYEILSPLGAGGMGEVYKAKDTRLDRTVAIKVLPAHVASNPEARQRFEREARAVSSLNHPHICTLHDVGQQDGVDFLVLELLEGQTLADRLVKGPLPVDQVLRHGIEIAGALQAAHRRGIVHRDLKPANIMIAKSGVKLLDFGLAKQGPGGAVVEIMAAPGGLSASPTATGQKGLTAEGTILGTLHYMAPEQLEGKPADARTDIFALGLALYEMATGRRAFDGKSQASLIAAILERDPPPISSLQPMTPPALDRLVKKCLEKDPDDRWQTAHDLAGELGWIAEGGSQVGVPAPVAARRRSRERLWAGAAIVLAAATLGLSYFVFEQRRAPVRVLRTSILPPEKCQFSFASGPMALSPDGRRIAFVATNADGKNFLWVRPLDRLAAQPLDGTESATYPFWSPDGRSLGFFAGGKLKKIDASGGPPETICDAPDGQGGSWNTNGVIIFAPTSRNPIHRVSASGGTSTPVTEFDASRREGTHRWPVFLPDGTSFLYLGRPFGGGQDPRSGIFLGSLDSRKSQILLPAVSSSIAYAPPGYVLFWRERTLMAVAFDARNRKLAGDPFPLAENIQYLPKSLSAVFSISQNGILAYQGGTGIGMSQLTWFDRSGRPIETVGPPADYNRPRLSHRGDRLAVDITDTQTGNTDIWILDLSRHTRSRFTFNTANDFRALWSPADDRIVFTSTPKGPADLYMKPATGSGGEEILLASNAFKVPSDWSSDGRFILFQNIDPEFNTGMDAFVLSVSDQKASAFLQTAFDEIHGQFSPDGRWVAYTSNESGRDEVYIQPFPGPGGKWQISSAGGSFPRWRNDGRELFYFAPDSSFWSVDMRPGATLQPGIPGRLFAAKVKGTHFFHYDVSADGQRFLVNVDVGEGSSTPITLVENWTAELKK